MDKDALILAIQKTAAENGGVALGARRFEETMGISTSAWRGRYWRNWSEAVRAAGLVENHPKEAHGDEKLIRCMIELTRKNRRFPSYADLRLARRADSSFPTHHVFTRLGSIEARVALVRQAAVEDPSIADVLEFLPAVRTEADPDPAAPEPGSEGFVYMLKYGDHYKVGKTFSVPRRHREIALELPEKPHLVHAIRTDDPTGIENYWHARFAAKRTNGEWFALSRDDVRAFKRRKFM